LRRQGKKKGEKKKPFPAAAGARKKGEKGEGNATSFCGARRRGIGGRGWEEMSCSPDEEGRGRPPPSLLMGGERRGEKKGAALPIFFFTLGRDIGSKKKGGRGEGGKDISPSAIGRTNRRMERGRGGHSLLSRRRQKEEDTRVEMTFFAHRQTDVEGKRERKREGPDSSATAHGKGKMYHHQGKKKGSSFGLRIRQVIRKKKGGKQLRFRSPSHVIFHRTRVRRERKKRKGKEGKRKGLF